MKLPRIGERGFLVLAAALLVLGGLVVPEPERAEERTWLSTDLVGPHGGGAWLDVARELELEPFVTSSTWFDLDGLEGSALAVLAPRSEVLPGEAQALVAWIEAGGRALWVLASEPPASSAAGAQVLAPRDQRLRTALGVEREPLAPTETGAAAVRSGSLDGPDELESSELLRSALALEPPDGWSAETLYEDGVGLALAARLRGGRGEVVVVADAEPLGSGQLAETPLATLVAVELLRLAREATPGADRHRVAFDERHHGRGLLTGPTSGFLSFLLADRRGLALTVLLALGALWLALGARRIGPPLPEPPQARRSSVEHAEALAAGYARARARARPTRTLLEASGRGLQRERQRASGSDEALHALAGALAHVREHTPSADPEALAQVDAALATGRVDAPEDLVSLGRALDHLHACSRLP